MDMKKLMGSFEENKADYYEELHRVEDEQLRLSKIEIRPGSIEIVGSQISNENLLIIGRTGEGKTIALKHIIKHLHADEKGILVLDGDSEHHRLISSLGGLIVSEEDLILSSKNSSLICFKYKGRRFEESEEVQSLKRLYEAIPFLSNVNYIVVDEGQAVISNHFDLFMECVKLANDHGIQFIITLQALENTMNNERCKALTKKFSHVIAFKNYESGLERITANLKSHQAIYFNKEGVAYSINFDPSKV